MNSTARRVIQQQINPCKWTRSTNQSILFFLLLLHSSVCLWLLAVSRSTLVAATILSQNKNFCVWSSLVVCATNETRE